MEALLHKELIPNTHRVTGRFFALIIRYFQYETTSLVALSRGISSALVAVSAATDDMKSWTAFFQGFLAAGVYSVLTKAVLKHQIDDPVEVIPVMDFWEFSFQHFLTLKQVYGCDGKLLGMQLFGFLIIFVWVGFFILITLLMLKGFGVLELISHIVIQQSGLLGIALLTHKMKSISLNNINWLNMETTKLDQDIDLDFYDILKLYIYEQFFIQPVYFKQFQCLVQVYSRAIAILFMNYRKDRGQYTTTLVYRQEYSMNY